MEKENNTTPQELNQTQALNVLIQAVRIAQAKGAYTLEDAALVAKAIAVFVPPAEPKEGLTDDPVINKDKAPEAEDSPTEPVIEKVK